MGTENELLDAVLRYLEAKEKSDPQWTLHLGRKSFTAAQLRDRIPKDNKLWKMIRGWADILAVDMFNEGSKRVEGNSGKT